MDVSCSIKENAGKIMIGLGAMFVVLGIMTLTTFYAVLPMYLVFVGFLFLAIGFFAHVGLFSVEWRSLNGLAVILLCISVASFALAITSTQFQEIISAQVAHIRADVAGGFPAGRTFQDWLVLRTDRPFISLSILGMQLGVAFFVASLAVKTLSHFLQRAL